MAGVNSNTGSLVDSAVIRKSLLVIAAPLHWGVFFPVGKVMPSQLLGQILDSPTIT